MNKSISINPNSRLIESVTVSVPVSHDVCQLIKRVTLNHFVHVDKVFILIQRTEEEKHIRTFCLTSVIRNIEYDCSLTGGMLGTCINTLLFFAVIGSSARIYNRSSICMFHFCHTFSTEKLKWAQNQIRPHWGGSSCPKWIPGLRPDLRYRRPGVKSCFKSVNRPTHCVRVWTSSQLQQCTKIWPGTGSKHQQEAY